MGNGKWGMIWIEWETENGKCFALNGKWKMGNDLHSSGNGNGQCFAFKWKMENGECFAFKWKMGKWNSLYLDGKWEMGNALH